MEKNLTRTERMRVAGKLISLEANDSVAVLAPKMLTTGDIRVIVTPSQVRDLAPYIYKGVSMSLLIQWKTAPAVEDWEIISATLLDFEPCERDTAKAISDFGRSLRLEELPSDPDEYVRNLRGMERVVISGKEPRKVPSGTKLNPACVLITVECSSPIIHLRLGANGEQADSSEGHTQIHQAET